MKFNIISKPVVPLSQSPILVDLSILENIYGGSVAKSHIAYINLGVQLVCVDVRMLVLNNFT